MAGGKLISTGVEFPDATTQTTSGLPLTGGTMTGTIAGFTSTGIDDNATSTAITIDSAEHVSLAHGIGFNGDTAAANALDDYEEGTWTPTVAAGTVSALGCWYTKVGNKVTVGGLIFNFSDRTSATQVVINNLPFTTAANTSSGSIFFRHFNTGADQVSIYTPSSSTTIQFWGSNKSTSYSQILHSDLNSVDARAFFSITYQTA